MRTESILANMVAAALLTIGVSTPAAAQSASASLGVSATVAGTCTISTSPLAFGTYDPVAAHASADLDGSGTVTVACTQGIAPTIGLDLGSHASGSARRMSDGAGGFLGYELYQNAGRSVVWGNDGGSELTASPAASSAARDFTVYGQIPSSQDVPSGSYSDTVVATVNF